MWRFALSVALLASTACAQGTIYRTSLVIELVAKPAEIDGTEQTAEEAAAAETKRQRENEQARMTGARLERERTIAKAVRKTGEDDDAAKAPVDPYAPERLDPSAISAAIDSVRSQVMQCRTPGVVGQVIVRIKVAADGHVRSVEIERAPDSALGKCVVLAVSTALFPHTRDGGSFRYPFVF